MRARWVAKEFKTHARPELYASTPPLEALKIVLSEIGTGRRAEGVLLRSSTKKGICRIAARGLPAGGRTHVWTAASLYGTRDAAQNWEEELAWTLSGVGLTRRSACPCVWRGRIKREDAVATVHGDDIKIGGQRSAVESLIKMISKKYEIKKKALKGDPDLEKSGRILNSVLNGIATASQLRQIRGMSER